MPEIDDHTLLLQLERTYTAVEEKLGALDREIADHTTTQCECACMYHEFVDRDDFADLRSDLNTLYTNVNTLRSLVEELRARL